MKLEKSLPIRPLPTLLLVCSFGLWAGAAIILFAQIKLNGMFLPISFGCILAIELFLGLCVYRTRASWKRYILILLLGVCTGLFCGHVATCAAHTEQEVIHTTKTYGNYLFEIIEDEQENEYGASCIAKTILSEGQEIRVRLNLKTKSDTLRFGHCISANTSIELPSETSSTYLWSKGIIATATVYSFETYERSDLFGILVSIRDEALSRLGSATDSGTALLQAILFGERSNLDDEGFYQDIRAVGLAHLVAVSGAHLVIVSASLQALLSVLRIHRKGIIVTQVVFLVLYLVLTGMPISALRAACMSGISLLSFYPGRRSSALNALGICVIAMIVLNPWSAISISFLLSSLSTLGIIVLVGLFTHWMQHFFPALPRSIQESIAITLAASVLISPLAVALFSQYSIISPVMNVIAAPCFTLLCVGGLLILCISMFFPPFADFTLDFLHGGSQVFCDLIKGVADLPYVAIPAYCDFLLALFLSFSLLIVIWCLWPKPQGLKLAFLGIGGSVVVAFVFFIAPYTYSDEVIMLDVGQGDAFLVRSQGLTILIDTGNSDSSLLRGLGRYGVHHLDAIVISHADDDHCGSLSSLQSFVQVDRVCAAKGVFECKCSSCSHLVTDAQNLVGDEGVTRLAVGARLKVGAFDLEVIWPDKFTDDGGNADSLSLLLTKQGDAFRRQTMLFCGDAEVQELATMIDKKRIGAVDIYKVGHHGSKNALNDELAEVLKPRLALVSVGKNNRYGHPANETVSSLERVGAKIMRTDEEGDVVCKFEYERLEVSSLG